MSELWKAVERRIATYLGGERVPVTGRQRGSAPDIAHETLSIEVKQRRGLPAWILDAMDQAEASRINGGQVAVVILHANGMRLGQQLAVVRLEELRRLTDALDDTLEAE